MRHLAHLAQQPRWRLVLWLLATASLLAVLGGSWMLAASMSTLTRPPLTKHIAPVFSTSRDHLLIYAFSYSDPQYLENLRYFITEAIANDTVADHVIIVQEGPSLKVSCPLCGPLPWGGTAPLTGQVDALQLVECLTAATAAPRPPCRKQTCRSSHRMRRMCATRTSATTGAATAGCCCRQGWSALPSIAISSLSTHPSVGPFCRLMQG